MRVALWLALALNGAPLSLLSLAELALLVADRSLPGLGALPMALLGFLALYNASVAHLNFSLLALLLLTSALSHAFPSRFPLSSLQPLALAASALPLLGNPSLTPLAFVVPLLLQVFWRRQFGSQKHADEAVGSDAMWLVAAVCSLVLTLGTRAHFMRGVVDAVLALGLLAALLTRSAADAPRLVTDWHASALLVLAPPMLGAFLYLLLSSHNSSVAALLPGHGALRALLVTLAAFLLLLTTLYRRFLPAPVASPALVLACSLAGYLVAYSLLGLLLGALSAWLLVYASPRNGVARVPASALCAALLMLQLSHRAAPHLSLASLALLMAGLLAALIGAAWLAAPRLAPQRHAAAVALVCVALSYALLERTLAATLPWWTCALTSFMLYTLALRLRPSIGPHAAFLLLSLTTAKSALIVPALFPHLYASSSSPSLLSPHGTAAVLPLALLSAALLHPLTFRPTSRAHFLSALAAAIVSAFLCVLLLLPPSARSVALACVPLCGAPAVWAWHQAPALLLPLGLPLVLVQAYARALLGPLDALLLATALLASLASWSPTSASHQPSPYAQCLAVAAGAVWLTRPASWLVSALAAASAALWSWEVRVGGGTALLGEASLALVLFSVATQPALVRALLYVRVLAASAAVHVAVLLLPPPSSPSALSLPQPVLALFAFGYSLAAARALMPEALCSTPLLFALLAPLLLAAPPPPGVRTRIALPLAFATAALYLAVLLATEPALLSVLALTCALVAGAPLVQVSRVALFNSRSPHVAPWLVPLPFAVLALIFGALEARLLAALGIAASVWLVQHGYRDHLHDMRRV